MEYTDVTVRERLNALFVEVLPKSKTHEIAYVPTIEGGETARYASAMPVGVAIASSTGEPARGASASCRAWKRVSGAGEYIEVRYSVCRGCPARLVLMNEPL